MFSFFKRFRPPGKWEVPVIFISGILFGLVLFLIYISKAPSYLSDDPQTCVNCHIMAPEYVTWYHSSHREYAVCNDCHVPQDNIFRTYYFKAKDGLRHATIFTLRAEPQVIFMHDPGKAVVQENCLRCHEFLNMDVSLANSSLESARKNENMLCWSCHREVPHGSVNSLSSVPHARVPLPGSPVPEWIRKHLK
jgi:cytochrome c nitrite reductase small subunit